MSSLAYIFRQQGNWVGGSDRNFDCHKNRDLLRKLQKIGISLYPQDGSAVTRKLNVLVVSSAVEGTNPDVQKARTLHIPVVHRAQLLAEVFNASYGVGVAGTSGKSTVAGMLASILDAAGKDPTVINGGIIKQYVSPYCIGNAKCGGSPFLVSEIDESDGSIVSFRPQIGVVTNISRDHKELLELEALFQIFAAQTAGCLVLNGDCPASASIRPEGRVLTFGLHKHNDITADTIALTPTGSTFNVRGTSCMLKIPGRHNLYNALAAIAAGCVLDIPLAVIRAGLAAFKGIKRRLDVVGRRNGITVIDDFAHNPDKITASIAALKAAGQRLIVVFQPHGFGPTRFLLHELAAAFSSALGPTDYLLCLDIYDAGGTADRSITSADLLTNIKGPRLDYPRGRDEAVRTIKKMVRTGDVVAVMGARDDTLSAFARKILRAIS